MSSNPSHQRSGRFPKLVGTYQKKKKQKQKEKLFPTTSKSCGRVAFEKENGIIPENSLSPMKSVWRLGSVNPMSGGRLPLKWLPRQRAKLWGGIIPVSLFLPSLKILKFEQYVAQVDGNYLTF